MGEPLPVLQSTGWTTPHQCDALEVPGHEWRSFNRGRMVHHISCNCRSCVKARIAAPYIPEEDEDDGFE